MFDRVRRKLSRTISGHYPPTPPLEPQDESGNSFDFTASDEELVSRLTFSPDTDFIERAPRHLTPSISTKCSERTVFNNVESGFLSLPTEVLGFLQPYLTPSSEVSLRHTCSRFFHLFDRPSFYLNGDDKLDFLCMLERDQDPRELDRLVCGVCRELHPRTTFASSEITQPSLKRDCRQVWLCAHRHIGYDKAQRLIKAGAETPFRVETLDPCKRCRDTVRNRSVADRPDKSTSINALQSPRSQTLLISKIALMQAPVPSYNTRITGGPVYREIFQVKEVSDALQAVNFRICSHIKLGDPCILSTFCRACINPCKLPPGVKGPVCISQMKREFGEDPTYRKCKASCFVRGCNTSFMFQARESLAPDASGNRQIWLMIVVYRWLGPLLTDTKDSKWFSHTVNNQERNEMRTSWMKWSQSRSGCLPNWSICALHPDDCNLR